MDLEAAASSTSTCPALEAQQQGGGMGQASTEYIRRPGDPDLRGQDTERHPHRFPRRSRRGGRCHARQYGEGSCTTPPDASPITVAARSPPSQRAGTALIWLDAEAKDPENRSNRRGRMRAVLDLLDLCEAIQRFHAGRGDDDHLSGHARRGSRGVAPAGRGGRLTDGRMEWWERCAALIPKRASDSSPPITYDQQSVFVHVRESTAPACRPSLACAT